jgi:GNAT superfamily N-acetyltransferase
MTLNIVRRSAGAECGSILAELPEWFGIPEANADYATYAEREPTWVAEEGGDVVGVMTLVDQGFSAIDIHLLAVRRNAHRRGVGKVLIDQAVFETCALGRPYLTVKTRGPSLPYEPYDRTRTFYLAVGFEPLEEFTEIWGPENPCLIMIMPMRGGSAHGREPPPAPLGKLAVGRDLGRAG